MLEKLIELTHKLLSLIKGLVRKGISRIPGYSKHLYRFKHAFMAVFILSGLFLFMVSGVPFVREYLVPEAPRPITDSIVISNPGYIKQVNAKKKEFTTLKRRYDALTPGQNYLVINTTDNRFYLYRNRVVIREGYCSSGSYIHLKTHDDREWIFKTPRGMFRIQGKTTYPVWRKPDWAFIEEGLPVPSPDHHSRFEYGALGDYALSLGDGYLIHGTIYKRSLGMPVTHGCIRLNDDDLEAVFNSLYVGSKVYIY